MAAYYNEIDPYAAQWLRNLIDAGRRAERGRSQGLCAGPVPGRPVVWRRGLDGSERPLEPGLEPVVDAYPGLLEQLRAYGNAINAEAARIFIEATM